MASYPIEDLAPQMDKRLDCSSGDVIPVEHVAPRYVEDNAGPHEPDKHPPNPAERPTAGELVDGGQVERRGGAGQRAEDCGIQAWDYARNRAAHVHIGDHVLQLSVGF